MALIDDDQIKKSRRELAEELLPFFRPGDGLIQPKVNFIRRVDSPRLIDSCRQFRLATVGPLDRLRAGTELGHCWPEGPKIVDHRLVDQHVPIGQE